MHHASSLNNSDFETDAKRQKVNEPSVLNSYSGGPLNVYIPGEGPYMYEECESVPRSPAYHPNVEQCRLLNKQAMEELLNHIMDGEQQDFEIQRLSQEFSDKRHIQMTNKMVMALDGDTGSGKSTTINSILGKTVLATKGCGGASCTQVVAEYADNPDTQGYEAHVHILPHEVIHDRVKAHVKKFRAHHQRSQSDDEPFSPVDDLAGEADTALEYFRTLFCDRPDCRTDREIKNLLLSPSSTDAVTRFMQWIVQIKHSLNVEPHDTKFTFRASGLSELVAKTSRCTEKMNLAERTSSLWPIVGKVRFFLNSPFLRQSLELVDLPGLSDANEDRRNSSLTYLREFCSGIIVVAKADRPETHPSVIASVKRAIRLKGPSNVILVLTRTDDCPENPTDLSLQESEHLKILQYAFDASKTTFAEAKQNRVPRHELRRLREDKKFADVALQKARVLIRNQHLVHKLQSAYREFTRGSQLCVVPVSNANHQEHLHGFDEEDPPCLGVEDDGIRNLRHELLRILGHRTIETLERHRVTVNSLLTGLDLWLQRSRNDRKDMAIGMVKTHLEKCNNPLPQHERNLIVSFRDKFHASVGRQLGNVWQDKIVSLVEGWGKQYPANSFKAFCRRNGVHQPKGHAVFSMNEAVLAIAEKDLDRFERQMHDDIIKHSDDLTVYINGVFVLIEKGFESEHNTAGIDMTALIKRLDQRKWALGQNLREITATLKAELQYVPFVDLAMVC